MKKFFLFTVLFISFFAIQSLSAQCPGCMINVPPGLPEDTIYLTDIPDGSVGLFYEEDISFRLPKTTTPVNDPDVPNGLTISEITITSLSNLPPGLQWTASQTVFEPAEETDGCIRLCGTPLVADTFEIKVNIDAVVFGLSQSTSFTIPMVINPAVSSSDGFSMSNSIGCGSTTVSFTNNVPSNGNPGITYNWDFGNGNTSLSENPGDQTYTGAGEYIINYEAVIDTIGFFLNGVTVTAAACDDILNTPPDMHIKVKNPDGSTLFDSQTFENTWPPISVNVFYPLEDGDYTIEVIDDDIVGDDLCGTIVFDKFSGGDVTVGDLSVFIDILHPVSFVSSMDTVIVYEQPDAPIITSSLGGEFMFCENGSMFIASSYSESNQWYLDETPIAGAVENNLEVMEPGWYSVLYTSPDGCESISEEVEITEIPAPATPAFINDNNLLTMFDISVLPTEYSLQWYQDGNILEGETGLNYCITAFGDYTLEVVDLETGCSNSFTQTVPFNQNANCTTGATDLLTIFNIKVSPNPTTGLMQLSMTAPEPGLLTIQITDTQGRVIFTQSDSYASGDYNLPIDITDAASGLYFVQLLLGEKVWVEKVVLR